MDTMTFVDHLGPPTARRDPAAAPGLCVRTVLRLPADAAPPDLPDFDRAPVFAWSSDRLELRAAGRIPGFDAGSDADLRALRGQIRGDEGLGLPIWVGGRSFDGDAGRDEWRGFPGSAFFVPAWLWARTEAGTFFVRHALVGGPSGPHPAADGARPAADAIGGDAAPVESRADWARWVDTALQSFEDGHLQKVVLARRAALTGVAPSPGATWDRLERHPGLVRFRLGWPDGGEFLGATPETLLELDGDRLTTEALAGTARADEVAALLANDKDHREHDAVVTALRAAIAPEARDLVQEPTAVRRYGPIAHLRTALSAQLTVPGRFFHWLDRLHPSPAIAGLPRGAAMHLIAALEQHHRGYYAGIMGVTDGDGHGHAVVALRSGLLRPDAAWLFAGAGIVRGSSADREWAETELKMRRMAQALAGGRR